MKYKQTLLMIISALCLGLSIDIGYSFFKGVFLTLGVYLMVVSHFKSKEDNEIKIGFETFKKKGHSENL